MHSTNLLSRREALTALAGPTAMVVAGVAVAPPTIPVELDTELLALGNEWRAINAECDRAHEREYAAEDRYERIKPRRPDILTKTNGDADLGLCSSWDAGKPFFKTDIERL